MYTLDLLPVLKLQFLSFATVFTMMIIAMGADIFVGYLAAGIQKKVASSIFGNGMRKKLITVTMVLLIECFNVFLLIEGHEQIPPISKYVCLGFVFKEITSVLEHGARAGIQEVRFIGALLAPFINRLDMAHNGGAKPTTQYLHVTTLVEAVNNTADPSSVTPTT